MLTVSHSFGWPNYLCQDIWQRSETYSAGIPPHSRNSSYFPVSCSPSDTQCWHPPPVLPHKNLSQCNTWPVSTPAQSLASAWDEKREKKTHWLFSRMCVVVWLSVASSVFTRFGSYFSPKVSVRNTAEIWGLFCLEELRLKVLHSQEIVEVILRDGRGIGHPPNFNALLAVSYAQDDEKHQTFKKLKWIWTFNILEEGAHQCRSHLQPALEVNWLTWPSLMTASWLAVPWGEMEGWAAHWWVNSMHLPFMHFLWSQSCAERKRVQLWKWAWELYLRNPVHWLLRKSLWHDWALPESHCVSNWLR